LNGGYMGDTFVEYCVAYFLTSGYQWSYYYFNLCMQ
jgi:hypothetical protein